MIAFECLLGRRPFESEAIGSLVLDICSRPLPVPSRFGPVPIGFDEWFARACARSPEDRFPSAKEQAAALRSICGTTGGRLKSDTSALSTISSLPAVASPPGDEAPLSTTADPIATTRRGPSKERPSKSGARRLAFVAGAAGLAGIAVLLFKASIPGTAPGPSKAAESAANSPPLLQADVGAASLSEPVASAPISNSPAPNPSSSTETPPASRPPEPRPVRNPAAPLERRPVGTTQTGGRARSVSSPPAVSATPATSVPSTAPSPVNLGI